LLKTLGQQCADHVQDLKLNLDDLRQKLGKPILVSWANRAYFHPADLSKGDEYNLFVLCSASKRVHGAEMSEGGYIQGAGDDSEGWSHGLTPPVFWANKPTLFGAAEEDLPGLIGNLMEEHRKQGPDQHATLVRPTRNTYIGQTDPRANDGGRYDLVIDCNEDPAAAEGDTKRLNLGCARSKLGSRDLRKYLDKVQAFVSSNLTSNPSQSLLVTCESGRDLSAGALLTILCLFYDENGILSIIQSISVRLIT
jgi:tRNA A64-2'-O-ribosylphosphate transferase